jgi:molybdate transport system substrate-binding protein
MQPSISMQIRRHNSRRLAGALLVVGLMMAMARMAAAGELPAVQGELTILTAASLTDAFKDMAAEIEKANPGTKLTFNFAGSPTLRAKLAHGARADVFASAGEPNTAGAQQDGAITGQPQIFARNVLVVVVPAKNPAGIQTSASNESRYVMTRRMNDRD